jgi:hypothetical protein
MIFQGYINVYIDTIRIIRLYVNDYSFGIGRGQTEKSFHEYEKNMPNYIQTYIGIIRDKISGIILKSFSDKQDSNSQNGYIIIGNKQEWDIMSIIDMNELYIPSIDVSKSDVVMEQKQQKIGFYDGPFFFLPYCHVYKCILGIQGDDSIHSFFPQENKDLLINKNEFVAYDYNCDAHYTYKTENDDDETDYTMVVEDRCIMLKFHYILFPIWMPLFIVVFYKKLHIWFNTIKWVYKNM